MKPSEILNELKDWRRLNTVSYIFPHEKWRLHTIGGLGGLDKDVLAAMLLDWSISYDISSLERMFHQESITIYLDVCTGTTSNITVGVLKKFLNLVAKEK